MDLSELLELLCKGLITSEQLKEELMKKDAYSGKEVCELLQAVVKRMDGLEAKLGIVGEINEQNLEKIKEELLQKVGTLGSIKIPKSHEEYFLLTAKAEALGKIDKLKEAAEIYLYCDCFLVTTSSNNAYLFLSFCINKKDKFDARILDKYDLVLKAIGEQKDVKRAAQHVIEFYSKRAEAYDQFGDKESAEKDRKELQKILEKM